LRVRRASLAGGAVAAAVAGVLGWSALAGPTAPAVRPSIFSGSIVLADDRPLTVVDLATADVAVRLQDADARVGAPNYGLVQPVPLAGGTLLVNRDSGAFNFVDPDDYAVDPSGGGVALGPLPGAAGAEGVADGRRAWIVRSAPRSTATLVGRGTVASAASGSAAPPDGFGAIPGRVSLGSAYAAAAGAELWLLAAGPVGCRLYRVGLGGARFVSGAALPCSRTAVEAAAGGAVWALPGGFRFFGRAGPGRFARAPTGRDDRFVPVSGAGNEAWFLARGPRGWTVTGWRPAAAGSPPIAGPFPLRYFGPGADPAPPALSGRLLYTLDRSAGPQPALWTVDVDGGRMTPVAGAPRYPRVGPEEDDSFGGAYVTADGPRVVFDNPESLEALVVFTDGTHAPVVVDKTDAVTVSTTGPEYLDLAAPSRQASSGRPAVPTPPAPQPVDPQAACADTTQKPYAPSITSVAPSTGAALIVWSYRLLDPTDCEPDAWTVHVVDVSGSAQPTPAVRIVRGQQQLLFTGLRPATTYQATVSAYINSQSTPSQPATFTTAARGPDAPLSVTTTSDGKGDWVVSWVPCTEQADPACVVPADRWTVLGSGCASGFVGTPPVVTVPGDVHSVTVSAEPAGLLGEYLTFEVQGSLSSGLAGNPTSDGSCVESWRPPDPAAIQLSAEGVPAGGTISAVLQVQTAGDPTAVFGAQPSGTDFVYTVGGVIVGPTHRTEVTVAGLAAGQQYVPSVEVYPAGHPQAAVTVTGQPFSQTLPWPSDLQSGVSALPSVGKDPNEGTVTIAFPPDVPSGPLTATAARLVCGSTSASEPDTNLLGGRVVYPVDLVDQGGACKVTFTLVDGSQPDPYGGPSPPLSAAFDIGVQPQYDFDAALAGDCKQAYSCGPLGQPWQIEVDYTGGDPLGAGGDWSVSTRLDTRGPDVADPCASVFALGGPAFPYLFDLPQSCPDPSQVRVSVSYTYLGQVVTDDAGTPSGSSPPATLPPETTTTVPATTTTTVPAATTTSVPATTTTTVRSTTTTHPAAGVAATRPGLVAAFPPAAACGGAVLACAARSRRRRGRG
jgi:hypothetical protein